MVKLPNYFKDPSKLPIFYLKECYNNPDIPSSYRDACFKEYELRILKLKGLQKEICDLTKTLLEDD